MPAAARTRSITSSREAAASPPRLACSDTSMLLSSISACTAWPGFRLNRPRAVGFLTIKVCASGSSTPRRRSRLPMVSPRCMRSSRTYTAWLSVSRSSCSRTSGMRRGCSVRGASGSSKALRGATPIAAAMPSVKIAPTEAVSCLRRRACWGLVGSTRTTSSRAKTSRSLDHIT
ncbi:hypothetical protein D9M68_685830 [compost metagenome]